MRKPQPVLVGVGIVSQREPDPVVAQEPLALMVNAAKAAGADAGSTRILSEIQRVYVPQGRWRYRDPARAVASAVGAVDATTVHAKVGVLQQTLLGDACQRIGQGELDVALVVGGEGGYRLRCAAISGVDVTDTVLEGTSDVVMRPAAELMLDVERRAGLGEAAVGYYAIIESAFRARRGWSVSEHRDSLARLYHRLSEVAAKNADAWNRVPVGAEFIREGSPKNRMLAFPYTKLHSSSWSVDQASALLLCSTDRASALGIPRDKWVFALASAESNHMVNLSARATLDGSPGARIAGRAVLDHGELEPAELDFLELYSCFPVAVESVAAELGISMDRDFSVTGGMTFAGGPFNNFVLHSTGQMARMLRRRPGSRGLVSSVSGVLTKQGFGLWGAGRGPKDFMSMDVGSIVSSLQEAKDVLDGYLGPAVIAGYTVLHEHKPKRAVAVVDVNGSSRTVAYSENLGVIGEMETVECCGRPVLVEDGRFDLA